MKLLKQLSQAMGVSGAEGEVRALILDHIRPHADDIQTDTMGNILAHKKGSGAVKMTVMLDAHMDEVGLMVIGHTSEGMLRVAAIGGLDDRILPGLKVLVGPQKLPGVIGVKPIHITEGDEREKTVKIDNLRVDIGAASKSAAEGKAPLGTRIGFDGPFAEMGQMARGKAIDDRAGCAALIHLLQGERYPFDIAAVFTVQEEIGTRGAKVAAFTVEPDAAVILETTTANDLPGEEDVSPVTVPGKGPALSVMDRSTIYDARLNDHFAATAEALDIPYQFKSPGSGGTDAGSIHLSGAGVPVVAICVPCRYLHSPLVFFHRKDYQNTIRLVDAALRRLDRSVLTR